MTSTLISAFGGVYFSSKEENLLYTILELKRSMHNFFEEEQTGETGKSKYFTEFVLGLWGT